jgi:ribonuclease H-related protein
MSKYYAVKKGKVPGVYNSWSECQKQTTGFKGAVFKSFYTLKEAKEFAEPIVLLEKYDAVVYTDGSFKDNIAGGAAVIPDEKIVYYSSVPDTQTNNRGELMGCLLAILYTQGSLLIKTDSEYCINGMMNGYSDKENNDLISMIKEKSKGRVIHCTHVDAHTGVEFNEMADRYADLGRTIQGIHFKDI